MCDFGRVTPPLLFGLGVLFKFPVTVSCMCRTIVLSDLCIDTCMCIVLVHDNRIFGTIITRSGNLLSLLLQH